MLIFVAESYSIVWMHTTFCSSTHPVMDICCFHLLATMNHAALNIGGQVSVKVIFSVLSGLSLGVELLGHVVALTC